jgi:hypothetical protein
VLHVVRAVGELHELEAVPLVEAPRRVLLEDPEVELLRTELLRLDEQRRADAAVLLGRLDVELLENRCSAEVPRRLDPEEAEQPPVLFGDPDFFVLADPRGDRNRRLVGNGRKVVHLVPRPDEQSGNRLDLFVSRPPDLHAA